MTASVWVAAETATARVLRDHFVDERGVASRRVSSHSYWTLDPTES